jgi:hypothetical protein
VAALLSVTFFYLISTLYYMNTKKTPFINNEIERARLPARAGTDGDDSVGQARLNDSVGQAWAAMDKIFTAYGNCEPVKENLWEILKHALTCEQYQPTALERANMIYCFEKIREVLDAAYVLYFDRLSMTALRQAYPSTPSTPSTSSG